MTPVKSWQSFADQLQLLKSRGLQVDHDEAALRYLARIGYYRLSGYWYPMRVIDKVASAREKRPMRLDQFVEGSRFEDAVKLYIFVLCGSYYELFAHAHYGGRGLKHCFWKSFLMCLQVLPAWQTLGFLRAGKSGIFGSRNENRCVHRVQRHQSYCS